jgi:type II secretory pathway pseudopilin PulG
MIELLVVMFILAVLVALVASVGGYVMRSANEKETATIQAVLMDAIQAWHDKDTSTPKQYPPDRTGPTYVPDASAGILMDYLEGRSPPSSTNTPQVRAATEILLKLPKEAWGGPASGPVRDSWGVPMRYHATGGLGGRPVIISAGPDGKFDPSPYDEDNIRSDEAQ